MQLSTLVKAAILVAVVFFAWKWWSGRQAQAPATQQTTSPAVNCVSTARGASEYWGSNLHAFANPPYNMDAWSEFKSHVDEQISRAQSKCDCSDDACAKAKQAMGELGALVGEMDSAIRSGSPPPSDAVQRQERIDDALNAAGDAAK
ncbi:MAG TPA: hypothetical protein VF980_20500 [Thermoanaerobaculia bacterium]